MINFIGNFFRVAVLTSLHSHEEGMRVPGSHSCQHLGFSVFILLDHGV